MTSMKSVVTTSCLCLILAVTSASNTIWPVPSSIQCKDANNVYIDSSFSIVSPNSSSVLDAAMSRFQKSIQTQASDNTNLDGTKNVVYSAQITIDSSDETLNNMTDVSYTMSMGESAKQVIISSPTSFGAVMALQTLSQMTFHGRLNCSSFDIQDRPAFSHRSLRLDVASRYAPISLLRSIVEGLSMMKMNVLMLHFMDFTSQRLEIDDMDVLTNNLTGYYPQVAIKELKDFAHDRGVMIIPSFELPSHASGLGANTSVEFCEAHNLTREHRNTLADSENNTWVLKNMMSSVASQFTTEQIHVGGLGLDDQVGNCTSKNIQSVFNDIVAVIQSLNRVASIWNSALKTVTKTDRVVNFVDEANAASVRTSLEQKIKTVLAGNENGVLNLPSAKQINSSDILEFYQDFAGEIFTNKTDKNSFFGVSAFLDTSIFCANDECGAGSGKSPSAYKLNPRKVDKSFESAVSGILFPSLAVTAGASWHHADLSQPQLESHLRMLTEFMNSQSIDTCPVGCSCSEIARCGHKYSTSAPEISVFGGGFIFGVCLLTLNFCSILAVLVQRMTSKPPSQYSEI